ncbi:MAG: M48 family metallopeptidase [Blastocatellia bacterium]
MRRKLVLLCVLISLFAPVGFAQTESQAPAGAQVAAEKKEVTSYTLPPEKYEKAVAYSRTQYWLHFVEVTYLVLLLLGILAIRVAPRVRDWAERASRRRIVQAVIFVPLLSVTLAVLQLPLDIYGHQLARKYELSIQGWGSWFWDWTKGEVIALGIMSVLLYFFYGVVRRSPRRWWLYSGLAVFPLAVVFLFLSPLVLDPVFNEFEPLENTEPALVAEIEKVVNHGGLDIPRERMFEMKASEKVKAVNAYVTGFGSSKRVVLWDTTIANMTTAQMLFVVGHEMGHYMLGHIPKSIAFLGCLIIVVLFLVYRSVLWAMKRWQKRWGIRNLEDWASLPVLMLFFVIFGFLAEPIANTFSRYHEHQADVYGLNATYGIVPDSSQAAAEAFQVLGEIDLADPNPNGFIKVWLYGHPPLAERLAFAREYTPRQIE